MEVRTIKQVRVYVLYLNTMGRAEDGAIAAVSLDYSKLKSFYESQLLTQQERYRDSNGMYISFADGPLKYFNPCYSLELNCPSTFGFGIHDEWIDMRDLDRLKSRYYNV